MDVSPISCWRPRPDAAEAFAAPPYDVFDAEGARAYVAAHPGTFLAIDRPETGFPAGQDPYAPEVYARAGKLIESAAADGTLLREEEPCFYLWRISCKGHAQTGVVAGCSVAEYRAGTIRTHERTHEEKVADRVRHIEVCKAQTGPVMLFYRDNYAVDALVSAASAAEPLYDFHDASQDARHTIWRIARPAALEAFEAAFSIVPAAYIADGHHRAEAAARVCERRQAAGADAGEAARFLAVLFPASQLRAYAYGQAAGEGAGRPADAAAAEEAPTVSLDEVMDAADAGRPMPPKSTWFSPKLLSGLFIRHL